MKIDFVSLFPESILPFLQSSMMARAVASGAVQFGTLNPRTFCEDKHQKVDDTPFGGHPGMLIKADPVFKAVTSLDPSRGAAVVLTSPAAKGFRHKDAKELAGLGHLIFLCGHYEGFDHRIEETVVTHSFSIGDFVMTNGELPAVCMADSVVRLLPGVLGDAQSLAEDSFEDGLLSAPNYTRPEVWNGITVPPVLLSGNHQEIAKWRRTVSLRLTKELRPDLLAKARLTQQDLKLLNPPERPEA